MDNTLRDIREKLLSASCPIPGSEYEHVMMAHGGGGKLTRELIERMFYPVLGNEILGHGHDGAFVDMERARIAFTTDSFVVDPVFFPGGDIGDLAVNGTVNDLVCCGATPRYISLAFILEEGLPLEDLWSIVRSIRVSADKAGVMIVTGDTKVVPRGKGDKVFINTSGIGEIIDGVNIGPERCAEGDVVIINGSVADHGISIMSKREGLGFETELRSDTAALNRMMQAVFEKYRSIHVMRDPTRGGLASALNEIADASALGITLFEDRIPVKESVRGACEIMGFDPLYIANEGKILVILPAQDAGGVIEIMRGFDEVRDAAVIGKVSADNPGRVMLRTTIGSTRIVDMITGEQLPRIC
jgi:hydrogenase expression/formation protein HypE